MAAGLHSSAANQTAGPDLFDADADAGAAFVGLPKLLVFGGNGYVGSHVCQQGIRTGVPVVSVSRSGRPGNADSSWADQVEWETGDAGDASTYRHLLSNCMGVISCIGGFGSNATMLKARPAAPALQCSCDWPAAAARDTLAAAWTCCGLRLTACWVPRPAGLKPQRSVWLGRMRRLQVQTSTSVTSSQAKCGR